MSRRSITQAVRPLIALLTTLLFVVAGAVVASPAMAAGFTISGTVYAGSTSTPVGAGEVNVRLGQYPNTTTVPTAADGTYTFTDLGVGYYSLHFDYVGAGNYPSMAWYDAPIGTDATPIRLDSTNPNQVANITLPAPSSITGRVLLGTNSPSTVTVPPVGDVRIYYQKIQLAGGFGPLTLGTTSGASGFYTIPNLVSGVYKLYFEYAGSGAYQNYQQWHQLTLRTTQVTATQAVLQLKRSISGHIYLGSTATAAGAGDVTVTLRCGNSVIASMPTAAGGSYSFTGLDDCNYRVWGEYNLGTGYQPAWDYADAPGALVKNVTLPVSVSLTGTVTMGSSGRLANDGEVAIALERQVSANWEAVTTGSTDDGVYSFAGLVAGTYRLRVTTDGPFIALTSSSVPTSSGPYTANVTMSDAFVMSGHVDLDESGNSVGAGDVVVKAFYVNSSGVYSTVAATTTTDASGNYSLILPAYTYYLQFDYVGVEDAFDVYLGANGAWPDSSSATAFNLNANLSGLDVVMGTGASITGTVSDTSGNPLVGQEVFAYGFDDEHDWALYSFVTTTMADGRYTFRSLPQGFVYLVDFGGDGVYAYEAWDDDSSYYIPDGVWIAPGDTTEHGGIDAQLERPATISGQIATSGIKPPNFDITTDVVAEVMVLDGATNQWARTGDWYPLAADGSYSITGLKPDNYRVSIYFVGTGSSNELRSAVIATAEDGSYTYSGTLALKPPTIAQLYSAMGGAAGPLGPAQGGVGTYSDNGGGALQHYESGSIYASNLFGTFFMWAGPIREAYWEANSIRGTFSWPSGPEVCDAGICQQQFAGGVITTEPLNVVTQPTISGPAMVGGKLTVSPGSYSPAATSFSYLWYRGGAVIPGATGSTYTVTAADQGERIEALVFAKRSGRAHTFLYTAPTAAVGPGPSGQIAAMYAANSGALGAATSGVTAYSNNGGGSLQHYTNGSIYSSFTGGTWMVVPGAVRDVYWGAQSILGAYGWPKGPQTCASGTCSQLFTGGTITVSPLTNVALPGISGTPQVGVQLTALTGTYSPAATSYTYRWLRSGTPIPGATTNKYTPVAADVASTLQVEVTASRLVSFPAVATSPVSAAVLPGNPPMSPAPTISGIARVGTMLTASTGAWPANTEFTFQWKANGVDIPGAFTPLTSATTSTFTPTTAEANKTITVVVVASNPAYATTTRTSVPSASVGPAVFISAPIPVIDGTRQFNQTLTVDTGVWNPSATFTYKWYANNVLVAGANSNQLFLTAALVGKRIYVAVTGAATGYVTTTMTSVATAPVLPLTAAYPRDLNGDAWPDIAYQTAASGPVSVAQMLGGGPAIKQTVPYGVAPDPGVLLFSGSDFITGGPSEMLAYKSGVGFYLWGPSGLGAEVVLDTRIYNVVLGVGDWNRDGKADILARETGGDMYLISGNGDGTAQTPVKIGQGWAPYSVLGSVGNMAGDAGPDIIARDSTGVLWLYPSAVSASTFGPRARIGAGWNAMTAMFGVGDLTGDTRDDLLGRDGAGNLWLYPGLGNATYSPRVQIPGAWAPAQFLG